jgi:transcriptional regulator with XRE-family HTH domain
MAALGRIEVWIRRWIGYSQHWKWNAEELVLEGDPENWAAVARAISDRVSELGWRQRELAERSRVSAAVVREIQRHTVERRRSRRTLEALSVALGWEPERLDKVLKGHMRHAAGRDASDQTALRSRLESFERRLDEISKLLTELKSDLVAVIDDVRDDS